MSRIGTQARAGGPIWIGPLAVCLGLLALAGCSTGGSDPLPGTGRIVDGDQCFLGTFNLRPPSPPDQEPIHTCEPAEGVDEVEVEEDTTCPLDLDQLALEEASTIEFCSGPIAGQVAYVDAEENPELLRLDVFGTDDEGRQMFLSILEIDLREDIGGPTADTNGVLTEPIDLGPCDFTMGINLDSGCLFDCEWLELSTLPCGGLELSEATDAPVTCYEDDQTECPSLTFGSLDYLTIKELYVVQVQSEEDRLSVLEQTAVSGEFSVTLRSSAAQPDGTFSEVQITGQFRNRVGAPSVSGPFAVTPEEELTCVPADCRP